MQVSAPEALDVAREPRKLRDLYGVDDPVTGPFARSCLTARRLVERGVRFVQVWSGAGGPSNNWDNHNSIVTELPAIARTVDRPIAALLRDLKARGLLDDTLVVWSTEFGRQPFSQGSQGRDHNGGTGVAWLAGAGVRGGSSAGQSDEWGWRAVKPLYSYDLHATILHLLGIDHEKLTYRHNGSDRRLTDVHGHVVREILA
jgi:arylsulfatase A-like enzyme